MQVAKAYDVSEALVSYGPTSFLICFIIFNFVANWMIDEKGIRKSIVIAGIMTALGCGIRCFVNISFYFFLIGEVLCAIAQPLIINSPMKIATRWFMPENVSFSINIEVSCCFSADCG